MAESTKIALLANTYNGIYKELRLEDRNPEARKVVRGEALFRMAGGAVKFG